MNRRTFIQHSAGTAAFLISHPLWSAETGKSTSIPIEGVQDRIERNRKGPLQVTLRDSEGKVIRGASLAIEQLRHDFLFGCNLFGFGRCGNPELEEQYRTRFAALLNYATLGFYWASYESQRGSPGYDYTDRVLEWTQGRGIKCKGHPLVWDHPAGSPRWLRDDAAEIRRLSNSRVREIVARFKGKIDIWDVVNEATHLPDKANKTLMAKWALAEGPATYVTQHLEIARQANPNAFLLVNDYRTDPPYYNLLREIRGKGKAPYDCVGIQSHMHGGPWPLAKVRETCDTYAKLELPLHFTETTIVSGPRKGPGENWGETTPEGEDRQAEETARFYSVLFSHPAVEAITWWDFSDLGAWQRAPAGWLRKDMSPKPVYERLLALIKDAWWTRAQGVIDERGQFSVRAFYGTHRVTVQLPNGRTERKEVVLTRKSPSNFDLTV